MSALASYMTLFLSAFLAATIIPAQSELALAGLIYQGKHPALLLFLIASLGNILGSVVNWGIGSVMAHYGRKAPGFIAKQRLESATRWFNKYGKWSLLLSWVPIIGDPLTLAAGLLRTPFMTFLLLVSIAKMARYGVIIYGVILISG
ncbi:MAG: YqaA family protein [Candidatus Puniceispirillaceae bacterium]